MILLVGCAAAGNVLVSLDDPSIWEDEDVPYVPFAVTNPVDFARTSPSGRLRRIAQAVTMSSGVSITLTPYGDGDEYEDQATTLVLDPAEGTTQVVEAEVALDARRFQYKMSASGFSGPVFFGEADLEMVKKRTA
jgi:hypothetical protein